MKIYFVHPNKTFTGEVNAISFKDGRSTTLQDSSNTKRIKKIAKLPGISFINEEGEDCTAQIKEAVKKLDDSSRKNQEQSAKQELITMIMDQGKIRYINSFGQDVTTSIIKLSSMAIQSSVQTEIEDLKEEIENLRSYVDKKTKSTQAKPKGKASKAEEEEEEKLELEETKQPKK